MPEKKFTDLDPILAVNVADNDVMGLDDISTPKSHKIEMGELASYVNSKVGLSIDGGLLQSANGIKPIANNTLNLGEDLKRWNTIYGTTINAVTGTFSGNVTGTWQGTAIADAYIASAITWNGKQDALTFGIEDTESLVVNQAGGATAGNYARFTATGLESRTAAEVRADINVDPAGTDNSTPVTLAGALDYLTIVGQAITRNAINLTTDVTGLLPDGNISSASTWNAKQNALVFGIGDTNSLVVNQASGATAGNYARFTTTGIESRTAAEVRSDINVDVAGTDNSTNVTLAGALDYLTIVGQVITRNAIDLTTDVTGALPDGNIASSGTWNAKQNALSFGIADTNSLVVDQTTGMSAGQYTRATTTGLESRTATQVRSDINVDPAGTDNSTDVTLAGALNYLTIIGQVITRNAIDLTTDVTGTLPVANGGTGKATLTPYAVLAGGTGATTTMQQVTGLGTSGQVLTSNGPGALPTWQTIAGTGDVTKVGTPVNNQMAVWTGDGTLEGTSDFTYDGTNLNLITAKNLQIAGKTVLTDATGTVTLSNVNNFESAGNATIRTGQSAGNKIEFQARDTDGASWTVFATLTANTVPSFDLASSVTIGGSNIQTELTFGIANTNALQVDQVGGATNGNYARFTASGLQSRTAVEVRSDINVDPAGTDNSTDVTLAGALDYLTIVGQVITRNAIDLTTDVTGALPIASGGSGQTSQQNAINALTNVAAATSEHVLTKDTVSGNALWKAATGGGASLATTLGIGNTTGTNNIIVNDSQFIYLGTDSDFSMSFNGTDTIFDLITGGWTVNSTGGGEVRINTNVGIGALPAAQFEVFDSSTKWVRLNRDSTGDFWFQNANNSTPAFTIENTGAADIFNLRNSSGQVLTTLSTGFLGVVYAGGGDPARRLHIREQTAVTNAAIIPLRVSSATTGSPVAGIGTGVEWEMQTTAGLFVGGITEITASNVGSTTEAFDYVLKLATGGGAPAEVFKMIDTGQMKLAKYTGTTMDGSAVKSLGVLSDGTVVTYTPAGSGDVTKVGTPVDNQMAVWTGDGTLEGTADLTYNGTSLNLVTAKNFQIASKTILADATGTVTISNINALDATTIGAFEGALTLSNLQGTLAVNKGGTGQTTYTNGQFLLGQTTGNTLAKVSLSGDISSVSAAGAVIFASTITSITSLANLTTVGTVATGTWQGTAIADAYIASSSTWDAKLSSLSADTNPTLGGNLVLNNKYVVFSGSPSSDHTGNGDIVSVTVDVNATGIGALLYKAADGNLEEADADASTTGPVVALALETGTGTKNVLLRGFFRDDTWNWTSLGQFVYLSTTTGALTQTAPSATGDQVQIVGVAWTADVIYFNPQLVIVGIA